MLAADEKLTLTENVALVELHDSIRQFAGQASGGSGSTVFSSTVLPSSHVSVPSIVPLPQTLAAIVVVVLDVDVDVVVDDVEVVGTAVVAVEELVDVDVVVVTVDDDVEDSVVELVVVAVDVVVVASVAVVDDVEVVGVVDVVLVEDAVVVDVLVVAVVLVDVDVDVVVVEVVVDVVMVLVVVVGPSVVVVGISGHGPSVARWMCVPCATKSPISVAPLFTWRSAFGAQSSRRTSAFRWIETVSPETNRSTSQGVTESSGTGPTSVALANMTFPPTWMEVGTLARSDPFRETWRSPQKTYASPVRASVPPFFTRTLP